MNMDTTSPIIGTYHEYKANTAKFTHWLVEAARATGKANLILSTFVQDENKSTGRLKGKARKDNKNAGPSSKTTLQKVPISAFEKLASVVANSKNIPIPRGVFTTLRAVIRGRKACAEWYGKGTSSKDDRAKDDDKGHQHFIKVLEAVLVILLPRMPARKRVNPSTNPSTTSTENHLQNMYARLALEDDDDATEENEAWDVPDRTAASRKEAVEFKPETTDEDMSYATYCLLKDATDLRMFVQKIWREYQENGIDLMTASMTTNAALAMIERLSIEFEEAFPDITTPDANLMHVNIIRFARKRSWEHSQAQASSDSKVAIDAQSSYTGAEEDMDMDDMLCSRTSDILVNSFFNGGNERLQFSSEEMRVLKCIALLGCMIGDDAGKGGHQGDFVTKAAWVLTLHKRLDTWAVFAVQILSDTQKQLGSELHEPFHTLAAGGLGLTRKYFVSHLAEEKKVRSNPALLQALDKSMGFLNIYTNDGNLQSMLEATGDLPSWYKEDVGDFSLLKSHPAMCGVILFFLHTEYHRLYTDLFGTNGRILAVAHLYNAAHQLGYLSKEIGWADMDFFIDTQGSDYIFVGGRPENGVDVFKRFCLAIGIPASEFARAQKMAKNPGSSGSVTTTATARHFNYLLRYMRLSWESQGNTRRVSTGYTRARYDPLVMLYMLSRDYAGKDAPAETSCTLENLRWFKKAIAEDVFMINFDIRALHLVCEEMVGRITEHVVTHAPNDYDKEMLIGNPTGTIYEFFAHEFCSHVPTIDGKMFPAVVEMLREVIYREGTAIVGPEKMLEKLGWEKKDWKEKGKKEGVEEESGEKEGEGEKSGKKEEKGKGNSSKKGKGKGKGKKK
ncbi:hypothetical protein IQ07DRAFT_62763 [Pyrenochaeta sp. DS3sAY3a]|nr:hypothetical protein IQ07DRAFT_62763 [Pyrenochaeta sp. DS3sAY3a]